MLRRVDERRQRCEQEAELERAPALVPASTGMHERLVRQFERRQRIAVRGEEFESVLAALDFGGEASGLAVGLGPHLRRPAMLALALVEPRRRPLALAPPAKCVDELAQ